MRHKPRGCELDSRSIERIVEHSSLPDRSKMHQNQILRTENKRMANGTFRPHPSKTNGNRQISSGESSSSSTERGGSYVIQVGRNEGSICGSEPYTDSGIHHTDSNHLEDGKLLQEEKEDRHLIGQRFGTFGRPTTMITSQDRIGQFTNSRLAITDGHSEENLQQIFSPKTSYHNEIGAIQQAKQNRHNRPFCPDWRCVLLCNMLVMIVLVVLFIAGYYYLWPMYMALLQASMPINGNWSAFSEWSACSVSCGGGGNQSRLRFCSNPPPEDGGLNCPGTPYGHQTCRAVNDCPDCNRKCIRGTISADCTRCTCEHHVITGKVLDGNSNPINGANIYKLGYYDVLAKTTQSGQFRTLSICANTDNTLFVTKVGFVPKSFAPKTTGNTTAVANVAMTLLLLPTITIIPESKSLRLCCAASDNQRQNSGSLTIQWYKNKELIPSGILYNNTSTDLRISKVTKFDGGVYQCKATNQAGIDMSQEVEITVKSETDTTCAEKPLRKMYKLPQNCDIQEANVGMCNANDIKSMCLHPSQLQKLKNQKCSDPPSEYCCGPVETKKQMIECRAPNIGTDQFGTYQIPITTVIKCGCTKC